MASYEDFTQIDVRVGEVIAIEDFPRARQPSYRVSIDFGLEIGIRRSSVQAKREYAPEELMHKQVVCVTNLPAKNIAGYMSEVLVLGVPAEDGSLSLLVPSRQAKLGGRMY
jgi:tRNA-binding protein